MAGAGEQGAVRGWRRARRWIVRGLLGVLALIVLAIVAVVIVLHTAWGRERVRRIAVAQLTSALGCDVTIGELDGSVFGTLTLQDVKLARDGRAIVTADSIDVAVGLWPLISETVRVDKLHVQGLAVDWSGAWCKKEPEPRERSGPSSWTIALRDLAIDKATVTIERPGAVPITLRDVTAGVPSATIVGGEIRATVTASAAWDAHTVRGVDAGGAQVAATIEPGQPIAATFDAHAGDAKTGLTLAGTVALDGVLVDHPLRAYGVVRGTNLPAGTLVAGAGGMAWIDLTLPTGAAPAAERLYGRVLAVGSATVDDLHESGVAVAAIRAGKASINAVGTGDGGARAIAVAVATIAGDTITLVAAHATGGADDPYAASNRRVPLAGALTFDATAHGTLRPALALAVSGTADAVKPAYAGAGVHARSAHAAFDVPALPSRATGTLTVTATRVERADLPLGDVTLTVRPAAGDTLSVGLHSRPVGPWSIDADTIVAPGATTRVSILDDRVQAGVQRWQGHGGTVEVGADAVAVHGVRMSSADGELAVDELRYGVADEVLTATVSARGVDAGAVARLAGLGAAGKGALDARAKITRAGDRWTGTATVDARRVALVAGAPAIDAHVELGVAPRTLTVRGHAGGAPVGAVAFDAEVAPPAQLTRPDAWKRLGRDALRTLHARLDHVDVAQAEALVGDAGTRGVIDGEITLGPTETKGLLHLRGGGLRSLPGSSALDADVALSAGEHGDVVATATSAVGGIAAASGTATVAPPAHPFDPRAWRDAGLTVLRGAHVQSDAVAVDPALLARLGVDAPLHGRVTADVQIAPALASAAVRVDARGVVGGPLARPVDVHAAVDLDGTGARAAVDVHAADALLASATARSPLAIADALDAPAHALASPLTGTVEVPTTAVATWLDVAGRADAVGTIGAKIDLGGTIGAPTARGALTVADLHAASTPDGLPAPAIRTLVVQGSFDPHHLAVDATASEANGGQLHGTLTGDVAALDRAELALTAHGFDLAPLAIIAPGVAAGTTGVLDADLAQQGLDPDAGALHGTLKLAHGSVPISPLIGTLRDADVTANLAKGKVAMTIGARLGSGHLTLDGTADLAPGAPPRADATIQLYGVTPIGAHEPAITGTIKSTLRRERGSWRADLHVARGEVALPTRSRDELHPVGAPTDMVFGDARAPVPPAPKTTVAHRPTAPALVLAIDLGTTQVTTEEARATVTGTLTVSIGDDGVALDGTITTRRADVDVLGRRYLIDQGTATFDGTSDPLLDVQMSYKFPSLTMDVSVSGRASKPKIDLSGDPATYTQDELFSFLLGAEPGGEPGTEARDAAQGATSAVASSVVGRALNNVLPSGFNLDVLRYQAATSSTSASVTLGKWVGHRLFLGATHHIGPNPITENENEGDVEWWVGRDWLLHVTAGDNQVGNADITHSWRW